MQSLRKKQVRVPESPALSIPFAGSHRLKSVEIQLSAPRIFDLISRTSAAALSANAGWPAESSASPRASSGLPALKKPAAPLYWQVAFVVWAAII